MAEFGSAANERSGNLSVDVPIGGHFVAHADGAYSKFDDLRIGGFVLSKPLREEALASPDPDIRALADLKGTLPNTAGTIGDIAGGFAYVNGETNIGISISHHTFRYGVPIRFSLDPAEEAEQPTIDGRQTRADLRANVALGGAFKLFEFRGGISKYHHDELTPEGDVGSSFFTHGGEIRADLVQNDRAGWGGTSGVQYLNTNVHLSGDEKYLPDSTNRQLGFFTLQSFVRGPVRFEAGFARRIGAPRRRRGPADRSQRRFDRHRADLGQLHTDLRFARCQLRVRDRLESRPLAVAQRTRRPRSTSCSPTVRTAAARRSRSAIPTSARKRATRSSSASIAPRGPFHVQGSLYYSRFSNFIFQAPTGAARDGLAGLLLSRRQGELLRVRASGATPASARRSESTGAASS